MLEYLVIERLREPRVHGLYGLAHLQKTPLLDVPWREAHRSHALDATRSHALVTRAVRCTC